MQLAYTYHGAIWTIETYIMAEENAWCATNLGEASFFSHSWTELVAWCGVTEVISNLLCGCCFFLAFHHFKDLRGPRSCAEKSPPVDGKSLLGLPLWYWWKNLFGSIDSGTTESTIIDYYRLQEAECQTSPRCLPYSMSIIHNTVEFLYGEKCFQSLDLQAFGRWLWILAARPQQQSSLPWASTSSSLYLLDLKIQKLLSSAYMDVCSPFWWYHCVFL